jgi:hypothetical protein
MRERPLTDTYPKPTFRDWALLVVAVLFTVAGAIILPHDRNVGIVSIAMFGPCAAVFVIIIMRKLRFRRLRALKAEIVGGVPIRQSRALVVTSSITLAAMGAIFILFGHSYGPVFLVLAWVIALIGGALLIGALSGWWPNGSIQFDPEGITFGRSGFAFTVPWDNIAQVSAGNLNNNPAAFMSLRDYHGILVRPDTRRARALKQLAWNTGWAGAPIVIFTPNYGMDLPLFMAALERYLADPSARAELAPRLLPKGELSAQT